MPIPLTRMRFEGRLPAFRSNSIIGGLASIGLVAAAIAAKSVVPTFLTLTILLPAVLLSAWVGGAKWSVPMLLACGVVGFYFLATTAPVQATAWQLINVALFLAVGGMIIFVVELLSKAVDRYQHERRRLDLALKAAKAALWESHPDRPLYWNDNFYDLVGLEYTDQAPPAEQFFEMVHPEDREKMREARRLMDSGLQPKAWDEFRLMRSDGKMLWLENHRTSDPTDSRFHIGIIHDITQRKNAEEKVELVLNEMSHRIKNQYAVIIKIAKDTYQQAETTQDFNEAFQARMMGLARSNDLLLRGGGREVDLRSLLLSQMEIFGDTSRVELNGPAMAISANAAQYLAMAFHELSTNALKHGAFSVDTGTIDVTWTISEETPATFKLIWQERGGPAPKSKSRPGFGKLVLEKLMPAAVEGKADIEVEPDGMKWSLSAPVDHVLRS